MEEIVAVDIGGTNARFVIAKIAPGQTPIIGKPYVYHTADHDGLASAWAAFERDVGGTVPRAAGIAVAAPLGQQVVKFTNSPWAFEPAKLPEQLGIDRLTLVNDFGAVAHAVACLPPDDFVPIAGPAAVPSEGMTTIVGLGTGLGVAQLLRRRGRYEAIETEGAHGDFGPVDELEDQILVRLRHRFVRVSDERVISGPALANLYEALGAIRGEAINPRSDAALWEAAISGSDPLAVSALDRLVLSFGSIAGDLALQHGANQVVISGGLSNRIVDRLKGPLFHQRFCAKGRYAARLKGFPIRLLTYEQPGLLGAAAAFLQEHLS